MTETEGLAKSVKPRHGELGVVVGGGLQGIGASSFGEGVVCLGSQKVC